MASTQAESARKCICPCCKAQHGQMQCSSCRVFNPSNSHCGREHHADVLLVLGASMSEQPLVGIYTRLRRICGVDRLQQGRSWRGSRRTPPPLLGSASPATIPSSGGSSPSWSPSGWSSPKCATSCGTHAKSCSMPSSTPGLPQDPPQLTICHVIAMKFGAERMDLALNQLHIHGYEP